MSSASVSNTSAEKPLAAIDNKFADALILSRNTSSDEEFEKLAKKMFVPFTGSIGKKRGDKKAKKASDIKRPKSPYMFFMQEKRGSVPEGTKFGDVAKQIATMWAALSEEEKNKYVGLSNEDKARYEREKKASSTSTSSVVEAVTV
jgi:hypothetical protein